MLQSWVRGENMLSNKDNGCPHKAKPKAKCKLCDEHRTFQTEWVEEFAFVDFKSKPVYLICLSSAATPKRSNVGTHHQGCHPNLKDEWCAVYAWGGSDYFNRGFSAKTICSIHILWIKPWLILPFHTHDNLFVQLCLVLKAQMPADTEVIFYVGLGQCWVE